MEELERGKRWAMLRVPATSLPLLLCPAADRLVDVVAGLPADAKVVRVGYDIHRDEVLVVAEHPSFRPVPAGGCVWPLELTVRMAG